MQLSIFYSRNDGPSESLTGYSDSDWAGFRDTQTSTTGIFVTINHAPVYWTSKRQYIVSLSSAEGEYVAASHCGRKLIWLHSLFFEQCRNCPCATDPLSYRQLSEQTTRQHYILPGTLKVLRETNILRSTCITAVTLFKSASSPYSTLRHRNNLRTYLRGLYSEQSSTCR